MITALPGKISEDKVQDTIIAEQVKDILAIGYDNRPYKILKKKDLSDLAKVINACHIAGLITDLEKKRIKRLLDK